jgi:Uma2 family endonuclease
MVIFGLPEYRNNRTDTITNPQVIVEVLSKSTKNYAQSDKFAFYKTLPTFREYIAILNHL